MIIVNYDAENITDKHKYDSKCFECKNNWTKYVLITRTLKKKANPKCYITYCEKCIPDKYRELII